MPTIEIRTLKPQEHNAAARLCAQAMLDNPIHCAVFGQDQTVRLRRLQYFFPGMLAYVGRKGRLYGAFIDEQMVGVFGVLPPGQCRPTVADALRLLPALLRSNSILGWLRSMIWLGTWAKIDPRAPHWHLGPLVVDRHWQGQGIGSRLLRFVCSIDGERPFYLETDKESNVRLYKRFGFTTTGTPEILGVPGWVMVKKAGKEKTQ